MAGDVVRPRLAAHLLDDQPCQCVGEVGVLPASLRRERGLPLRHQRLQLFARREGERRPVVSRLARQSRAVCQQLLDGDRRIVRPWRRYREPRQVLRHRIVEMELALLAQLHDGGCREQLAVRGHAEFRLRRHRHLAGDVGESEPFGPHEPLIRDDANDHSRVAAGAKLPVGPGAEQSLGAEDVRVGRGVFSGEPCANGRAASRVIAATAAAIAMRRLRSDATPTDIITSSSRSRVCGSCHNSRILARPDIRKGRNHCFCTHQPGIIRPVYRVPGARHPEGCINSGRCVWPSECPSPRLDRRPLGREVPWRRCPFLALLVHQRAANGGKRRHKAKAENRPVLPVMPRIRQRPAHRGKSA